MNYKTLACLLALLWLAEIPASAQRPNIILILLDDADKALVPPNAPAFVETPSIKRVYEEGAMFNNFYGVFPYCNPSRYSLVTGMYPHSHGATNNLQTPSNGGLPNMPSILQQAGYHNMVIGKFTNVEADPIGFDERFCTKIVDYTDPIFFRNGVKQKVYGNTSRIINDSMVDWISKVDTPFFAWIGHIAPHGPVKFLQEDKGIYDDEEFEAPSNAEFFPDDYPSFLYSPGANWTSNSIKIRKYMIQQYAALLEVDRGIARLFDTLQKRGLLDNTAVFLTNDNGAMYGEHYLLGKQKPYEATASLPLFIRYPKWFDTTTTTCYDQLIPSIDLVPTFIALSGSSSTPYHFQGIPLAQSIFKNHARSSVYYETIKDGLEGNPNQIGVKESPSWRTVRSIAYKYTRYRCDSLTEELFDMQNDSLELNNLALNASYQEVLNQMRILLDSLAIATHDTLSRDTIYGPCKLIDLVPEVRLSGHKVPFEIIISPQPVQGSAMVSIISGKQPGNDEINLELFSATGMLVKKWRFGPGATYSLMLDVADLPHGAYFLKATYIGDFRTIPFVIQ